MPSTLDLAARLSAIVSLQQNLLAHATDPEKFMNAIVREVQQITDGDGAAIEQVDGDSLVYRALSGRAVAGPGLRLQMKGSLSGLAIEKRTTFRCDDAESDPRVDREACRRLGVRSMIVVPLAERGTPNGVMKVFSERPNFFDDLDAYTLELLGGLTSAALMYASEFQRRVTSEERYRMLFEKNVAGVFRTTREGRILDCNQAFAACLGYASRDEVLSRESWDLYVQRTDREKFLSTLDRDRAMTNVRLPLRKKDGSTITGVVNVSLIPGDADETQLLGTLVCDD